MICFYAQVRDALHNIRQTLTNLSTKRSKPLYITLEHSRTLETTRMCSKAP